MYRQQDHSPAYFIDDLNSLLGRIKIKNVLLSSDINIDLFKQTNNVDNYSIILAKHGSGSALSEPLSWTPKLQTTNRE